MRLRRTIVASVFLVGVVAGCGGVSSGVAANLAAGDATASALTASHRSNNNNNNPQGALPCCFVTIECTVTQLLPEDTKGLPHQKFVIKETSPDAGQTLEVDNDEHYGTKVPGLQVGANLEIRGIEYHDPLKSGIHWTHHDNSLGDAGYIKTADGTVYQ